MIVGALLLAALPEVLRYVAGPLQAMTDGRLDASILRQLLIALAMIGIMLARPRGLWPSPEHGKAGADAGRRPTSATTAGRSRSPSPERVASDVDIRERDAAMTEIVLKVAGVSKRFGGLQALSDVGITIQRGQVYGLIGPNGAGKTTFFNVLTGLYTPDSRQLRARRQALQAERGARGGQGRHRAHLPEHPPVRRHDGARERDGRPPRAHPFRTDRRGLPHRAASRPRRRRSPQRAQELLDYVGIGSFAEYKARTLSYGDQRRLEIARALATDPQLIALDEPAAGMNATEKVMLRELIDRIRKRRPHHPADRARREAGDGPVRPRDRARLRQADRRRHAGRGAAQREGDRGLSRRRPRGHWSDADVRMARSCSRSAT